MQIRVYSIVMLITLAGLARADESVNQLIDGLSSESWKARQEAVEKLVARGDLALPALEALLAKKDIDEEVRSRAAAAVARIKDAQKIGMSRITVDLKDASVADALAAIAKQAGEGVLIDAADALRGMKDVRVSLNARHSPFWTVMEDLCRQTGLRPSSETVRKRAQVLRLERDDGKWGDRPSVVSGPLLLRAERIMRVSTVSLREPGDSASQFTLSMTALAEPKLRVLDYSGNAKLTLAEDEKGNSLLPPADEGANVESFGNLGDGFTSSWEVGAQLQYPKGAGRKITRLKGTVEFDVAQKMARLEAPVDGAKNLTKTLDGVRAQVGSASASAFEVTIFRDDRPDPQWYQLQMLLNLGRVTLVDEKGASVATSMDVDQAISDDQQRLTLKYQFGRAMLGRSSKGLKLTWEFPVEVREISVPFEMVDLPIP